MALAFRPSWITFPEPTTVVAPRSVGSQSAAGSQSAPDTTAFEQGLVWFERHSAGDDRELPGRAAAYLMSCGLSRDETVRAIETEFDLSPMVAATLVAAA